MQDASETSPHRRRAPWWYHAVTFVLFAVAYLLVNLVLEGSISIGDLIGALIAGVVFTALTAMLIRRDRGRPAGRA